MKTLLKNTVIAIIILTLFSCNKNDDAPREESVRLIAYSQNDNEYDLTYNDEGTLRSYQHYSFGFRTGNLVYDSEGRIIQNDNFSYEYNSQGRVSKLKRVVNSSITVETTCIYNNKGLIASTSSQENGLVIGGSTYEYDTDNKLNIIKTTRNSDEERVTLTFVDDNLKKKVVEVKSDDGTTYIQVLIITYTHDTKNNPNFNLLSSHGISNYPIFFDILSDISLNIGGETLIFNNKNNIMSYQRTNLISTVNTEFEYVYDDNDFPVSAERTIINSLSPANTNIQYYTWTYENY